MTILLSSNTCFSQNLALNYIGFLQNIGTLKYMLLVIIQRSLIYSNALLKDCQFHTYLPTIN